MEEKLFHCFEVSEPHNPAPLKHTHPYSKLNLRLAIVFMIADFLNAHRYLVPLTSISLQKLCKLLEEDVIFTLPVTTISRLPCDKLSFFIICQYTNYTPSDGRIIDKL
jgi:hypothetical protein